MIVKELDARDFFNLRLASKYLNQISFPLFLKRYFRTRVHMIERQRLENLRLISEDKILGPAVRQLCINPAFLTEEHIDGDSTDTMPRPNQREYERQLDDQIYLRESGQGTVYISTALTRLFDCKAVTLSNGYRAWGTATIERQTGGYISFEQDLPEVMFEDILNGVMTAKRAFRLVLAAVMASHVQLDELKISLPSTPDTLVLPDICSRQMQSGLFCLRRLSIELNLGTDSYYDHDQAQKVSSFISLFPKLEKLKLSFNNEGVPKWFRTPLRTLQLPCLRSLEVESIVCKEKYLSYFILRHKGSLDELIFNWVEISPDDGWHALLKTVQDHL